MRRRPGRKKKSYHNTPPHTLHEGKNIGEVVWPRVVDKWGGNILESPLSPNKRACAH
jgi:hypothetical protein